MQVLPGAIMLLAGSGRVTFYREEIKAQVPRWIPATLNSWILLLWHRVLCKFFWAGNVVFSEIQSTNRNNPGHFDVLICPGSISQYTSEINAFWAEYQA